jgi:hypothetical protein
MIRYLLRAKPVIFELGVLPKLVDGLHDLAVRVAEVDYRAGSDGFE